EGLLRNVELEEVTDLAEIENIFYGDLLERILNIKENLENNHYFALSREKLDKLIGVHLNDLQNYNNLPSKIKESHQRKNNLDYENLQDKVKMIGRSMELSNKNKS
ncbi:MAG: hypothetical protein ACW98D_20925, partial [Promethearchaeota archaeon]